MEKLGFFSSMGLDLSQCKRFAKLMNELRNQIKKNDYLRILICEYFCEMVISVSELIHVFTDKTQSVQKN